MSLNRLILMLFMAALTISSQLQAQQAPPLDQTLDSQGNPIYPNVDNPDKIITNEIKTKMLDDPGLAQYTDKIQVNTISGKVTLSGTIDSTSAKLKVESIARNTSGVKYVVNNMVVNQSRFYQGNAPPSNELR